MKYPKCGSENVTLTGITLKSYIYTCEDCNHGWTSEQTKKLTLNDFRQAWIKVESYFTTLERELAKTYFWEVDVPYLDTGMMVKRQSGQLERIQADVAFKYLRKARAEFNDVFSPLLQQLTKEEMEDD